MDYPKSVPGVGLVNGRFVDENMVSGTPGSLIPATWGNSVTQEMLAVITSAGLAPSEADNGQLLKALQVIMTKASPMLSLVKTVAVSQILAPDDLGLVLANGGANAVTLTLPAANSALGVRDVIVRRVDNSGNRLVVQCSGTDSLKFHTHLRTNGYPFLVLMGAGDWWHLRSDGAGSWWPVGRFDGTPLGRPVFETTVALMPGGYGALNGSILNRAEWPWLWDHAQQSGMLRPETDRGGAWTPGDGSTTFRAPEARGEFLRIWAEDYSVDTGRVPGTWQKGSLVHGDNGIGDNIIFATDIIGQRKLLGFDAGSLGDYVGSVVKYITPNTTVTQLPDFELMNHSGVARPRNIAYPGRIKLI
ncbi:phage tail protein [Pseudomonas helvetica]|uniref:phage tail protein n=1 Tax=Pseudomonas helvetica TaxID=3136738 RepID=UPI0032668205